MTAKERSFWSTTSGVVTGLAGTVTGLVALATMATQMGWVGSPGGGERSTTADSHVTTTTSGAGSAGSADRGGGGSVARGSRDQGQAPTGAPSFSVDPQSVSFDVLGERMATVGVRNVGAEPIELDSPAVEGSDADAFTVATPSCTGGSLDPGRSCDVEVTFSPRRSGAHAATLIIQAVGAGSREVPLTGAALL